MHTSDQEKPTAFEDDAAVSVESVGETATEGVDAVEDLVRVVFGRRGEDDEFELLADSLEESAQVRSELHSDELVGSKLPLQAGLRGGARRPRRSSSTATAARCAPASRRGRRRPSSSGAALAA